MQPDFYSLVPAMLKHASEQDSNGRVLPRQPGAMTLTALIAPILKLEVVRCKRRGKGLAGLPGMVSGKVSLELRRLLKDSLEAKMGDRAFNDPRLLEICGQHKQHRNGG